MVKRVLLGIGIHNLAELPPGDLAPLANALCYPDEARWSSTANSLEFIEHQRTCRMAPWEADSELPTDLFDGPEDAIYVPANLAS